MSAASTDCVWTFEDHKPCFCVLAQIWFKRCPAKVALVAVKQALLGISESYEVHICIQKGNFKNKYRTVLERLADNLFGGHGGFKSEFTEAPPQA